MPHDAGTTEDNTDKQTKGLVSGTNALVDRLKLQYGIDDFEANTYRVYLSDGNREKINAITGPIPQFTNSNFYDPIVMLDDTTALIGYRYIYVDGAEAAEALPLPFDYIFHASVSPDKSKIAYYAKQNQDNDIVIAYYNVADGKIHNVKTLNPGDYDMLHELSLFLDWGSEDNLYFDSPKRNLPAIERYNLSSGSFVQVASNAKCPSVSDDDTVLSWIEHDVYVGKSLNTPMTVIKIGTATQKFEGYSAIKYSNTQGIYRVDYHTSKIDKLDTKSLEVLSSIKVDGSIIGASIKDDVLTYYSLPSEYDVSASILEAPEVHE